jgi:hypothetical protein
MAWIRLDDQIAHHPKFVKAGAVAAWLWVCGQSYCGRYLTDGFIPCDALSSLGTVAKPEREAARLVAAGLWDSVDGGWQIHDYHDYQPTREEVERRRENRRESGRLGGRRRHDREHDAKQVAKQHAKQGASDIGTTLDVPRIKQNIPPVPVPVPVASTKLERTLALARFERFWGVYPRKVGRDDAERAWLKLKADDALTDRIIAAVTLQARGWDDPKYTPHASTWLNGGRWKDEVARAARVNGVEVQPQRGSSVECEHDQPCDTPFLCAQRRKMDAGKLLLEEPA